jgi:Trk K+ transport system NAD-binding subunit
VLLNNDSEVIYCTLLSKNLNANAFVIARANRVESAEKIYRAGADYVASLPTVASHMLAKIVEHETEELGLLYEDLELKTIIADERSHLAGRSLGEMNLPERFGCGAVAIKRDGRALGDIDQSTLIEGGDLMAIIGSIAGIESFSHEYQRKSVLHQLIEIKNKIARL